MCNMRRDTGTRSVSRRMLDNSEARDEDFDEPREWSLTFDTLDDSANEAMK
jgi:hypothetical protein